MKGTLTLNYSKLTYFSLVVLCLLVIYSYSLVIASGSLAVKTFNIVVLDLNYGI